MASKKLLAPSLRTNRAGVRDGTQSHGQQEIAGPFVEETGMIPCSVVWSAMASKKLLAPSLRKVARIPDKVAVAIWPARNCWPLR